MFVRTGAYGRERKVISVIVKSSARVPNHQLPLRIEFHHALISENTRKVGLR